MTLMKRLYDYLRLKWAPYLHTTLLRSAQLLRTTLSYTLCYQQPVRLQGGHTQGATLPPQTDKKNIVLLHALDLPTVSVDPTLTDRSPPH